MTFEILYIFGVVAVAGVMFVSRKFLINIGALLVVLTLVVAAFESIMSNTTIVANPNP